MSTAPFKNFVQLTKYFNNELVCAKYLEDQRWGGTPLCPHCGSEYHYRTQTRFKHIELKDYKDFRCKACDKKYTVLTGTIYEKSKINLTLWFQALYLISAHKKGISSLQLASDLGVTQKTAWFMNHRIREMLREKAPNKLQGVVSADETYVGGKASNMHEKKKKALGTNIQGNKCKAPVIGIMEKGGSVRAFAVDNAKLKTLTPIILGNIREGSILVTDAYTAYKSFVVRYEHHVVIHENGQYVTKEGYTTNNVENFWSLLKRGIDGIYHSVSPKYLQRYCDEYEYRHNNRGIHDIEKFKNAIKMCNDTGLSYKLLTL